MITESESVPYATSDWPTGKTSASLTSFPAAMRVVFPLVRSHDRRAALRLRRDRERLAIHREAKATRPIDGRGAFESHLGKRPHIDAALLVVAPAVGEARAVDGRGHVAERVGHEPPTGPPASSSRATRARIARAPGSSSRRQRAWRRSLGGGETSWCRRATERARHGSEPRAWGGRCARTCRTCPGAAAGSPETSDDLKGKAGAGPSSIGARGAGSAGRGGGFFRHEAAPKNSTMTRQAARSPTRRRRDDIRRLFR